MQPSPGGDLEALVPSCRVSTSSGLVEPQTNRFGDTRPVTESSHQVVLVVNGTRHVLAVDPSTPLLYLLRNDLGLTAPPSSAAGSSSAAPARCWLTAGRRSRAPRRRGRLPGRRSRRSRVSRPALRSHGWVDAFAAELRRAVRLLHAGDRRLGGRPARRRAGGEPRLDRGRPRPRISAAAGRSPRCVIEAVLQAAGAAVAP